MPAADASSREERLLDAAAALIIHYGYDKTTVGDIAAEAGVSKGAVYLHWSSKEELFETLLIRETIRLLDDIEARVDADPEGGTVQAVYRHGLRALIDNPFMRALYTRDIRVLGDRARRGNMDRRTRRFLFGQEYVRQMQAAGLLRADLSPKVITFISSIFSYGLLTAAAIVSTEEAPPLEETLSAMADVYRLGLVPPSGGDSGVGKRALKEYLDYVRAQYRESQPQRSL